MPLIEVPTEDAIEDGVMPNYGRSWFEHLVPGTSLDLKISSILFNQQKGNSTFEITETLVPSGFSKISKNVRRRKYSLSLFNKKMKSCFMLESLSSSATCNYHLCILSNMI